MNSYFKISLITLLLMVSCRMLCQTNVSGVLNSNTVWTKTNSPYNIVGNVGVNTNANLTIEPGVRINYTGDYEILVYGSLTINGQENDPIKFYGTSQGGAGTKKMLEFRRTNLSNSLIKYAHFNGPQDVLLVSRESEHDQETIKVSGVLTFEDCNFYNSTIQTDGYNSQGKLLIRNSTLAQVLVKGRYPRSELIELSNCNIDNSTIFSDSYNKGIKIVDSYINNTSFLIGCCGANFDVSYCKILRSNFVSDNDYHEIKISNSILFNTLFEENERSWYESQKLNLSNSIFITDQSEAIKYQDVTLSNSSFIGCEIATAIESSSSLNISNCNFKDWQLALRINNGNCRITGSNFLNNNNLIEVLDNKNIDAGSNYWGGVAINDKIKDQNDDLNWGLVKLDPILQNLSTSAHILSPRNLILIDNGSDYTLKWDKLDGLDYKLYFNKIDELSYSESIVIGAVNEYNLSIEQANDFALTASNSQADGMDDQLQGYESWFACSYELSEATSVTNFNSTLNPISVYPNPTHGILYVENIDQDLVTYELRNVNGKLIQRSAINELNQIDISHYEKGLYFLRIEAKDRNCIFKVIKE
ncbi:MAG: T9SS type A sorting domain-containing protein [Salinivirgaceae bacterium]|nr:T9SS type A sorting domain-containing protein [Salinivirgaceae bacterium]